LKAKSQLSLEQLGITLWEEAHLRGIGLESTILFAREGASVLMADVNPAALEKGIGLAKQYAPNSKIETFIVDVSKEKQVEDMVLQAEKVFGGGIDVIFNNAGIMHPEDDNALNTEERIWLVHRLLKLTLGT
jgi:NAD(P)-dependent dehydrogenase (short-subunit alcohol dehydrogenase family)